MSKTFGIRFDHDTVHAAVTEKSPDGSVRIIDACARRVPLTPEERESFVRVRNNKEAEDRQNRRSSRKNKRRYLLRRRQLIELFKENGFITDDTPMDDVQLKKRWHTWEMRAKAPVERIPLEDLARVFMMMNKHRGYRGTKGSKDSKEGTIIDGIAAAKIMAEEGITPGQFLLKMNEEDESAKTQFYPSDLKRELVMIISAQRCFHPEMLDDIMSAKLLDCTKKQAAALLAAWLPDKKTSKAAHKAQITKARANAVEEEISVNDLAEVILEIIKGIEEGSAFLGQMSDRSKDAYLAGQTPGQWIWEHIRNEGDAFSTRSLSFFRSDYKAEFEKIWQKQAEYHEVMTDELKEQIMDHVLYWQRDLKAKKAGYCPFESFKMAVKDPATGEKTVRTVGCRRAPKSSPLFQEFRMMNDVNNLTYQEEGCSTAHKLDESMREKVLKALRLKKSMKDTAVLKAAGLDAKRFKLNFKEVQGNTTLAEIESVLQNAAKAKGYRKIKDMLKATGACETLNEYDWTLPKEEYEKQPLIRLWILIDSYVYDDSASGTETLARQIAERFGTDEQTSRALSKMTFATGHGSLSHKAMRKLLPHLAEGTSYYDACLAEGYQVSTTENKGTLLDAIPIVRKGELMNPVTEKIINQLINVINALIEEHGNPDAINVELPRELNSSKKQREAYVKKNKEREKENKRYAEIIRRITGNPKVSAMQILRYRLYEELKENGYRTLYSDRKLDPETVLNTDLVHREHIIPQSVIFDDNFVNYTLEFADVDADKADMPARDFVLAKYGQKGLERYLANVEKLYWKGTLSTAKYKYLLMQRGEVPNNILDRQTPARQYAMKELAKMLALVTRKVMYTVPAVTRRLKEDWDLDSVATDINVPDYEKAGRVSEESTVDGKRYKTITVREYNGKTKQWETRLWNPSMDPRSGIADAIVISLTTPSHIEYLNNLSAAKERESRYWQLRNRLTTSVNGKRVFTAPMNPCKLKEDVTGIMANTLVSVKPNGRVTTSKKNVTRTKGNKQGKNVQYTRVPRGPLHDDTIFRKIRIPVEYEITIRGNTKADDLRNIKDPEIKNAVLKRLHEYKGSVSDAFGGNNNLSKVPLWLDDEKTREVPATVQCVRIEDRYLVRTKLTEKTNIKKICNEEIRNEIKRRIAECGDQKKLADMLTVNPLTVNGHVVKSFLIMEKGEKMVPIRYKRDNRGELILDENGERIPCDYVRPGSNHHFEVFEQQSGEYHIKVVTFMECIDRINNGLDPYDKEYNLDKGWRYLFHVCKKDAVIFPDENAGFYPERMSAEELDRSPFTRKNLYYLQKMSEGEYVFRHHADNNVAIDSQMQDIRQKKINNASALKGAVKVKVNHIGRIVMKLNG